MPAVHFQHPIVITIFLVAITATKCTVAEPVLAMDFEDQTTPSVDRLLNMENLDIVNASESGNRVLRATYEPFEQGTRHLTSRFSLPPAVEYTLSYDLFLEEDFQFTKGGKLHGLIPDRPVVGGNPDRPDGWSARVSFLQDKRLGIYAYYQDKPGQYGRGGTRFNRSFRLAREHWYAISLNVRVNEDPTTDDGHISLYINGMLIESIDNIQLRGVDSDDSLITSFLFSTFHGGNTDAWTPKDRLGNPISVHALFDNFTVHPGRVIRSSPGTQANEITHSRKIE